MAGQIKDQLDRYRQQNENTGRLLIKCPDQPGIVSAVTAFIKGYEANIIELSQYSLDPRGGGTFFTRIEFECPGLNQKSARLQEEFAQIAADFSMEWRFTKVSELKKMAVFVSKEPHCLLELLWEWQSGEILADIALVISNHEDNRELAEALNIPFFCIPANKEIRKEAERAQLDLLKKYETDVVVLARYMQILTPEFVAELPNQIINIHHSFLPAFIGARPYERAYERGVKLIGATAHYVTNNLDEGPIIEQDIERVNHRDNAEGLKKIGRSIERRVLARAVKWHIEDRVIVHGNKTVVF